MMTLAKVRAFYMLFKTFNNPLESIIDFTSRSTLLAVTQNVINYDKSNTLTRDS